MGRSWIKASSLLLLLLLFLSPLPSLSSPTSDLFDEWCRRYGKTYSSEQERRLRQGVFEDNLAFVAAHNAAGNSSYALALNAFADLTHAEFKSSRLGLSAPASITTNRRRSVRREPPAVWKVPPALDWRMRGAVTPVKDQGSCGACWSFSATGAIEGVNKIVTGSLLSLSEQELIDCDRSHNSGCSGGLMDYAYQFVISNHGIDTENDYPYQGGERPCDKQKVRRRVVTIEDYDDVPESNGDSLLQAVATQPVSVGICGSARAFQLYSEGIFTGPCSTDLDHAVLIVGYGSANGVDYWIVKNSWGVSWGMNGYMHILRNSGNSKGICGINMLASYPIKTHPNPPIPPSPGPRKCDLFRYCANTDTCCCAWHFLGLCITWKCCDLEYGVCCRDHHYCCPQDYPICDTRRKQCLRIFENATLVKKVEQGSSPGKYGQRSSFLGARIL